uniref:Major capsid protein n=1 Tax=Podoviridae sp. ctO1718 TaxID=2827733 RepID=A0A8S5TL81_9CAUD|nr:MAG TPA: major capsid protein [Podoviridae sp. ctO1718]
MAGGKNLATKYSNKVDERFTKQSQAMMALNNDYEFTGVETVKVYSIPVVPLKDYSRSGSNRYGTPDDLQRNVQTMTVKKDRAFTFIIDKGDKLQSQMVMDSGKALSRQTNEVMIPEFDAYCFKTLADAATEAGNSDSTAPTKNNAYELFLKGMESLGDNNVPDQGRVAFCSYAFANLLKQDSAFMKYGNTSQEMLIKGVIGEVDGAKIVKVPSSRLPAGCAFILCHPLAATAPKQLEEFKTHDNPPGISGWLCEGRFIYDCFVLDEKVGGIYYQGGGKLKKLTVQSVGTATGKSTISLIPGQHDSNGKKWYYNTAATKGALLGATQGTAITKASWTELTAATLEISVTSGHKFIEIVEVDSADKPLAHTITKLNAG